MFSERILQTTFFVSVALHAFILIQNPDFAPFAHFKREQIIEVRYVKISQKSNAQLEQSPIKKEIEMRPQSKIDLVKMAPPPFVNKEDILKVASIMRPGDSTFTKPALVKSDIALTKRKVTLPSVDVGIDKINNPTYINYYEMVREKIRRAAYFNFSHEETGEVYLSFIVATDGSLRELQLMENRSSASPYLRETALRSVKDASPFPAFPSGLDHPQLSFNVVISFEIE